MVVSLRLLPDSRLARTIAWLLSWEEGCGHRTLGAEAPSCNRDFASVCICGLHYSA
jgi:hypothetical protein